MPTGYTEKICSGKEDVPVSDFIRTCARGMGALVLLRDNSLNAPIPDTLPVMNYHEKRIQELEKEHGEICSLSIEECNARADSDAIEQNRRRDEAWRESEARRSRYENMIAQIEEWVPPTKDHDGLKNFMLKQLIDSMQHDCMSLEEWETIYPEAALSDGGQWRDQKIASISMDLGYHRIKARDENKLNTERQLWWDQLRASLQKLTLDTKPTESDGEG